ncbi:expressed unknown protein [Seminavis robusta]|uniref:Uncharacterized protein n=1 Tax=Seminavis robusta TaxID=568900 RepID=A0A9N8EGY7_9STRA|nr:expressed unknown protein [Seminavis robusta]|eukprot:Sro1064_g237210.1 n/a (1845) ;mRNA; r:2278-8059
MTDYSFHQHHHHQEEEEPFQQQQQYHQDPSYDSLYARIHAAQGRLPWTVLRASAGAPPELYYGVLSVAVETLALLLFVEAVRRKLDHAAVGRPIFQAVLDGVYRELATLGIVELFIHLLHEYYDNLDTQKEAIFVDVHFVFFYCAIFNAMQSSILAFFAHRVSYNTWVKTEEVELNHYVEIREEFDQVRYELYGDDPPYSLGRSSQQPTDSDNDHNNSGPRRSNMIRNLSEGIQRSSLDINNQNNNSRSSNNCWNSLKLFWVGIFYTVKYPHLKAKHDKLLVQVRFHELRIHFLHAYDLPVKVKISTYLMRSEQEVIKHLIHVSTMAWLWLTGLITFMYYITGMVTDVTQDAGSAGVTLPVFFFLGMVVFILVSLLVHRRMHQIFMTIMEMKHLWDFRKEDPIASSQTAGDEDDDVQQYTDPTLASEQKRLFFLGDPKLVIIAIQFMQFGFAIALSVVVVYWEDMNGGGVDAPVYLIVTLVCYCLFVFIMAQTLVRFTMATSLGQLVDRKRLHEVVALFRLEEAERRRQQRKDLDMNFFFTGQQQQPLAPWKHRKHKAAKEGDDDDPFDLQEAAPAILNEAVEVPLHQQQPDKPTNDNSSPFLPLSDNTALRGEPSDDNIAPMPPSVETPTRPSLTAIPEKQGAIPTFEPEKANLLVDLVKMDTSSLRNAVPLEDIRRAERRDRRRNRRKSVSDGVALMAALGSVTPPSFFTGSNNTNDAPSKDVAAEDPESKKSSRPENMATATTPKFAVDDSVLLKRKERRRNWKKSVSASAAIQQMRDFEGEKQPPQDANPSNDVWTNKIITTQPPSQPSGLISKIAPKKMMFSPSNSNNPTTKDDSVVPTQQRKDRRRRQRKKALSASAAIRLMREGSDDEDEERLAMMDFWGTPKKQETVPEDAPLESTAVPSSSQVDSVGNQELQQSEQQMQMTQPLQAVVNNPIAPPKRQPLALETVREVSGDISGHMEDESLTQAEFSERRGDPLALSPSSSNADPLQKSDTNADDDDETLDTDRSVGGLSHVGDVDEINYHQYGSFYDDEGELYGLARLNRFNDSMRKFYLSRRYGFVTHLLGSMGCFFIIGMRIEGFLKQSCIIPVEDHSWEFSLKTCFALVTTFLIFFLVASVYMIILFPAYRDDCEVDIIGCSKRVQWLRFVAAVIDMIISFTCLMLFFGAEAARCCNGNEYPSESYYPDEHGYDAANDSKYGDESKEPYQTTHDNYGNPDDVDHRFLAGGYDTYDEPKAPCVDSTIYCNCPRFGTRLEGGLGNIEPFVALIVLRMFRYILAKKIVQMFDLGLVVGDLEDKDDTKSSKRSHGGLISEHGGHGGVDKLKKGTVVELWQAAIAQFPEIVEEHGEFSGELLQAMLGVEVASPPLTLPQPEPHHVLESSSVPTPSEGATSGILMRKNSLPFSDHAGNDHITLQEKKYCKLAPEVQGIIAAGKLGCPVKSCTDFATLSRPSSVPSLTEIEHTIADAGAGIEFQRDVAQMELEQMESTLAFEYPNDRLVRSMRRCDKKLLPLLDKWCPVDVLLTKHEIVYVQTLETDGAGDNNHTIETGRQALMATKGGKNLRLIDVTAGRRVIGHMKLSDIVSVHVEREHRREGTALRSEQEVTEDLNHGHIEFWQDRPEDDRNECAADNEKRWNAIHQDSLKLETISGTLYLRFYSDLEDSEAHPERVIAEMDENNSVYKDTALQWAQTIARQCCTMTQLKQPLPHFGGGNDQDEIKDFLHIVPKHEKTGHRRRFNAAGIRGHRRHRSVGQQHRLVGQQQHKRATTELPALGREDLEHGAAASPNDKHPFQKEDDPSSAPSIPKPRKFTRFASFDDVEGQSQKREDDDEGRALSMA